MFTTIHEGLHYQMIGNRGDNAAHDIAELLRFVRMAGEFVDGPTGKELVAQFLDLFVKPFAGRRGAARRGG